MSSKTSRKLSLIAASGLFISLASANAYSLRTIDVLGVYPDHVAQLVSDPAAMFASNIEYANKALQNGGADYRYNLVHVQQVNWSSDDSLGSGQLGNFRSDAQIAQLREQYGADLVAGIVPQTNGLCGIGYLAIKRNDTQVHPYGANYAYSLTGHSCGGRSMAHEMGHNMGLGHSYAQGSSGTLAPWARGHGVNGQFVTIMAYNSAYGLSGSGRLQIHSTPSLSSCVGMPCGKNAADADGADAVRAINLSSVQIAEYRASKTFSSNQAPDARDDSLTTDQDQLVSANLLSNDSDPDNDALSLVSVSQPSNGTAVVLSSAGNVRYQPNPGFSGTDVFAYEIQDGKGEYASAEVTVTVNKVVVATPNPPAVQNLVINGGLEEGLEGWQGVWGTRIALTANALEGAYSLSGLSGYGIAVDLKTPLAGQRNLNLAATLASSGSNAVYVYLRVLSNGYWTYRYVSAMPLTAGSTNDFTKTFALPDAEIQDGFVLFYFPYRIGSEVRIDSVTLQAD